MNYIAEKDVDFIFDHRYDQWNTQLFKLHIGYNGASEHIKLIEWIELPLIMDIDTHSVVGFLPTHSSLEVLGVLNDVLDEGGMHVTLETGIDLLSAAHRTTYTDDFLKELLMVDIRNFNEMKAEINSLLNSFLRRAPQEEELNRILDRIHLNGLLSLSDAERSRLDQMSVRI